ncbi:STAS domain-containing protein [Candidatus Riflebacteria bacterium]
MSEFSFKIQDEGQIVVIMLEGYFNDLAAEQVEHEVLEILSTGKQRFVLDFEKSQVINSVGISILIGIIESVVEDHNGKINICNLNEINQTTFDMMGLFQEAGYEPTREKAIQKFELEA